MTRTRRTGRALLACLALVLALAGCVNVPTQGTIERVEGAEPGCENCVNVEVAPPAAGDDPRQIVEGFLRANGNYQPNYSVARQFLTRAAAEKWSPDAGVSIYSGVPVATGNKVTLRDGLLTGSLAQDRTFKAQNQRLNHDFGLVRDSTGEWRIDNPLPGLMVSEFSFDTFYQSYDLFFVGNSTLVPDPIYLPRLRNPANVASALTGALLNGPSKWLDPAVETAIPEGTTLSVDSVPITAGIAEVSLSDNVLALSDTLRSEMAAQVVYTLKQLVVVKGVKFTVNQVPLAIPGSDPTTQVVPVTAIPTELDPIPFVAAEQLYAVRQVGKTGRTTVHRVDDTAGQPTLGPVPGPIGGGSYQVDSLAVSVANTDLAVVTDDRTVLRRGPTANDSGDAVQTLISGVTDLIRPQFSRYGELWAVGRRDGAQQMWLTNANTTTPQPVDATNVLSGGRIIAFKVSPDGTRMAAVRRTGAGTQLGVARITRTDRDRVTVDGWRVLNTTQTNKPMVTRFADVGWLDATHLEVLGASSADGAYAPVQISADASELEADNQTNQWDAVGLTVLLRTQTTVVVGRQGQTFKDDGNRWQPYVPDVVTVAYPG